MLAARLTRVPSNKRLLQPEYLSALLHVKQQEQLRN